MEDMMLTKRARLFIAVASVAVALGACSSTGSPSVTTSVASAAASAPAESTGVCADAAAVKSSLTDLKSLDLKTAGKAGLTAAIDKVDAAVTTLATSAKDTAGPQVEALQTAIATLETVLGNLASDASVAEKEADIRAAATGVEDAATALKTALTQCS
jgi:hypothetical protein